MKCRFNLLIKVNLFRLVGEGVGIQPGFQRQKAFLC